MKIKRFETIESLQSYLDSVRGSNKSIGFIPTMGALHKGHIELINKARNENDIVVSSVFVNPTQFNNQNDLALYPRPVEKDIAMLEKANCDAVFTPPVEAMYPDGNNLLNLDLAGLDKVMEGVFRPGHFAGMITIVHKLFNVVTPRNAYFGEKDFQQLAIIKYMVKQLNMPVSIIGCATVRETDGLAMSSRNIHLTPEEKKQAPVIYNTLNACIDLKNKMNPDQLQHFVKTEIEKSGLFKVEYISFVDAINLSELKDWNSSESQRACIAVTTSKTRLIDNIAL
ncbi:MAG: pantoate--beta-alanine ligase [Bacteroidia bacterium]